MKKQRLQDALDAYAKHRKPQITKGTHSTEQSALGKLLVEAGNIYTLSLTGDHVDEAFDFLGLTNSPRSMVNHFHTYAGFFRWLHNSERVRRNPMAGRKAPKFTVEERRRVEEEKFPELLDAAPNPVARMLVACGLYLLSRSKEIGAIRVEDILPGTKHIRTRVSKVSGRARKGTDLMPITVELRRELVRYLAWYETQCGPLQGHWYLIPAFSKPIWRENPDGPGTTRYQVVVPDRVSGSKHNETVQECLEAIGFSTEQGGEGMHTLRRSGARARFNALRELGYDGALREVQMLLHHAHATMTEHYIGIDLDNLKRDEALIDQYMYPQLPPQPGDDDERVMDLRRYLPGAAAPNPDDVIDLDSRRPKPVVNRGDVVEVYPTIQERGFAGNGWKYANAKKKQDRLTAVQDA